MLRIYSPRTVNKIAVLFAQMVVSARLACASGTGIDARHLHASCFNLTQGQIHEKSDHID